MPSSRSTEIRSGEKPESQIDLCLRLNLPASFRADQGAFNMALRPSDINGAKAVTLPPISRCMLTPAGDARIFKPTNAAPVKVIRIKWPSSFASSLRPLACQSPAPSASAASFHPIYLQERHQHRSERNPPRSDRFAWSRRYPPGESIIFDLQMQATMQGSPAPSLRTPPPKQTGLNQALTGRPPCLHQLRH